MSSTLSNSLFHSRIIERLRCSRDPLSVVKALNQNGTQLKKLNDCAEIGALLCDIVKRNYGLGIKILFDCGLDLSIEDPATGDTPLLLLCSEGLCGSAKQLINQLPRRALLHRNYQGNTVLRHLLTRAHAKCGCLEALLKRLHPCAEILPLHLNPDTAGQVEHSVADGEQANGADILSNPNAIFLTTEALLNRIRSTDPERIFSVFQLWIKYNLILIQKPGSELVQQQHHNAKSLCHRLVEPMLKQTMGEENSTCIKIPDKLLHLITQLAVLGQINPTNGWAELENFINSVFDGISNKIEFKKAARYRSDPTSLQAISIFRLRQLLQDRFVQLCHKPQGFVYEVSDALVFVPWIRSLPLPPFMKSHILLESTDFHFHR